MKDILLFIAGCFAGKLIEDNLPDLNFKNLKKIAEFLLALLVVGYLTAMFKITRNAEYKKSLIIVMVAVVATTLIGEFVKDKKQLQRNNP